MTNKELIEALDKLDALFSGPEKWTQHRYFDNGRCCISGGVISLHLNGDRRLLLALSKTAGNGRPAALENWNDRPGRTFAEIKKLIADTRARLEAHDH